MSNDASGPDFAGGFADIRERAAQMTDPRAGTVSLLHTVSAQLTREQTPHVLIADGNPTSRENREAQLRNAGFRVSVARTGFEAIVKASCYLPDAILLADSLRDPVGSDTGRLLMTCPATSHIPVVALPRGRRLSQRVLAQLLKTAPTPS
jgi:CheY-like chemotaxis protein